MDFRRLASENRTAAFLVVAAVGIAGFDILRKTVFLGASWNYRYPADTLIYDPLAVGFFAFVGICVIVGYPRISQLEQRRFLLVLVLGTISLSVAGFFVTPERSFRWIAPSSGYYQAALFAANEGPLAYISSFHSLGTVDGSKPNIETARYLSEQLRSSPLPFGLGAHLADYVSEITVQKHGLIPPLVVAPALVLLGPGDLHAMAGSYLITLTIPVIAYLGLREQFSEHSARFGALLIATSPAYIVYQRYQSVAWDAITAVWIGASTALLLAYLARGRERYLVASGGVFSLAILSKASAAVYVFAVIPMLLLVAQGWKRRARLVGLFSVSSLALPVLLLPLGYNFLIQYAFTLARLQVEASSSLAGSRAAYLTNPLLNIAGPVYNGRLIGPAVLLFGAIFVLVYVSRRTLPEPGNRWTERRWFAALFLLPILPYIFTLPGRTISRHLLPFVVPITVVALAGLESINMSETSSERVARAALFANLVIALVAV